MRARLLALGVASAVVLGACSNATSSAPASSTAPDASASASEAAVVEPVEITFQADPDQITPAELWQGLVDKFNAENPDIRVKLILSPGSSQRDQYAKTLLQAGTFPDVAWQLSVDQFKDVLLPYDLADPINKHQLGTENMLWSGQLLSTAPSSENWNNIFYNKKMFADAGITSLPKTWPEFEVALEKLKASGVTPIVLGGEWLPGFYLLASLNNVFSESLDQCWYAKRRAGTAHFTDQGFVDAAKRMQDWLAKGYFSDGGLGNSYAEAGVAFLQGKGAMYPMGSFESGSFTATPPDGFEIGHFTTPSTDGKTHIAGNIGGGGLTVSKSTEHPAEATRFAQWMSFSPKSLDTLLSVYGYGANVTPLEGTFSPKYTPLQQEIVDELNDPNATKIVGYYGAGSDCGVVPGLTPELEKQATRILLGDDIMTVLADFDAYWDKNVK